MDKIKKENACCVLCGLLYSSWSIHEEEGVCRQGDNCASDCTKDGSLVTSYYGSGYDGDHFVCHDSVKKELASLDPVCDCCLAGLMLKGSIVGIEDSFYYENEKKNYKNYNLALKHRRQTLERQLSENDKT